MLLFLPLDLFGQVILVNPGIADRERLVYIERSGGTSQEIVQESRKIMRDGRAYFEVTGTSDHFQSRFLIDVETLACIYSETQSRESEITIKRTTELVENKSVPKPDELVITDQNGLQFALRGFPWNSQKSARLSFLGAGRALSSETASSDSSSSNLAFNLKVLGKEEIVAAGHKWMCWKLEMGVSGFWGTFFKKAYFWYGADAPYAMIKFEGVLGPPGTPAKTVELVSYSN